MNISLFSKQFAVSGTNPSSDAAYHARGDRVIYCFGNDRLDMGRFLKICQLGDHEIQEIEDRLDGQEAEIATKP